MKVFTYLPDSEYAENNVSKLDTIGCFAEYSNYQGLLLTSTIDGKLINGFRYNEGVLVSRLTIKNNVLDHSPSHEGCMDEHCSECCDKKEFRIHLYSLRTLARTTYDVDSETNLICSICGGDALKCDCIIVEEEPVICDKCGELKGYCICEIFKCDECGQDPCECPINSGGEDVDGGDEGGCSGSDENPSGGVSTGNNNSSTGPYTPVSTDNMAKPNIPTTMSVQVINACVPAIMELVSQIYGSPINEGEFWEAYIRESGEVDISTLGFDIRYLNEVVDDFFITKEFEDYILDLNQGYLIMSDIDGVGNDRHNILIVGYTNDSKLIYMDPEKGYLVVDDYTKFGETYNIVITGLK